MSDSTPALAFPTGELVLLGRALDGGLDAVDAMLARHDIPPLALHNERNQLTWSAILALQGRRSAIDGPILVKELQARGHEVGSDWITHLGAAHVQYRAGSDDESDAYIDLVLDAYDRRRQIELARSIAAAAQNGGVTPDLMLRASTEAVRLAPETVTPQRPKLPPFPVEVFPWWARNFIQGAANAFQVPQDLCGMMTLGSLAASSAGRFIARPWPGYLEQLNLYIVCALPTGERKSPIYRYAMQPIREHDRDIRSKHQSNETKNASERKVLEMQLKAALRAYAKDGTPGAQAEADRIANRLQELTPSKKAPKIMVTNSSPEALAQNMDACGGEAFFWSSEGDIFDNLAGNLYGGRGVPNLNFWQCAYVGDPYDEGRTTRDPVHIPHPTLTAFVCPQPASLQALRSVRGGVDSGFLGRWTFSLPHSLVGSRESTHGRWIDDMTYNTFRQAILSLCRTKRPEVDGNPSRHELRFSPEALYAIKQFDIAREPRIRGPEDRHGNPQTPGDLHPMGDWGNKWTGLVARFAGLLHCARFATEDAGARPETQIVSAETVEGAIQLGQYALAHAREAYRLMGLRGTRDLDRDAELLFRWAATQRHPFTRRDIIRSGPYQIRRPEVAETALKALLDDGKVVESDSDPVAGIKKTRATATKYVAVA